MTPAPDNGGEFSLVCGGPLYRLLVRLRLIRPSVGWLRRRVLVFTALAWLPLLVTRRGIVPSDLEPRFNGALASALRLRNSMTVELLLLAFAFVAIPLAWRESVEPVSTWIVDVHDGRTEFTWAGWWLVHASAPLFQFLLLRLFFRLFVWGCFLWQVSRLPLQLDSAHPDRAGGLGFLEESIPAFAPLLFAQAIAASGLIARRAQVMGVSVLEYKVDIAIFVVALAVLVVLPMCLLAPKLITMRRTALLEYGKLGASYVREFDRKWLAGQAPPGEALVGSADIQSLADLADLAGSYEIVQGMRPVPFSLRALMGLLLVAIAPFLPLAFTIYSLQEVVSRVVKVML